MPYKIITINLAKYDVADAIEYYDALSTKLGIRFEIDFFETLTRLENTPQHYFNLGNGFGRINLSEFPYLVLYDIDEELHTVRICGVFHQHSNPSFIKRRMKAK